MANGRLSKILGEEIGEEETTWLTQMLLLKQLSHKSDSEQLAFWNSFKEIRASNKSNLIASYLTDHANGFHDALISYNYSDFSDASRVLLALLFIADRALRPSE